MGMLLIERTEYYRETNRVSNSTWIVSTLKRIWDFLITFSPILWILFFSLLVVVINWLGG